MLYRRRQLFRHGIDTFGACILAIVGEFGLLARRWGWMCVHALGDLHALLHFRHDRHGLLFVARYPSTAMWMDECRKTEHDPLPLAPSLSPH